MNVDDPKIEEFEKEFADVIRNIKSTYNDMDYQIVDENAEKCDRIIYLLDIILKGNNGRIVTKRFIPHEINGYIEGEFNSLYLEGDNLKCFKEIVHLSDAISIDPHLNGEISISLMVKHVFKNTMK